MCSYMPYVLFAESHNKQAWLERKHEKKVKNCCYCVVTFCLILIKNGLLISWNTNALRSVHIKRHRLKSFSFNFFFGSFLHFLSILRMHTKLSKHYSFLLQFWFVWRYPSENETWSVYVRDLGRYFQTGKRFFSMSSFIFRNYLIYSKIGLDLGGLFSYGPILKITLFGLSI